MADKRTRKPSVGNLTIKVLERIQAELVGMRGELRGVNGRLDGLNERVDGLSGRIDRVLDIAGGHHRELEHRVHVLEARVERIEHR
jgi:hypothetical protein